MMNIYPITLRKKRGYAAPAEGSPSLGENLALSGLALRTRGRGVTLRAPVFPADGCMRLTSRRSPKGARRVPPLPRVVSPQNVARHIFSAVIGLLLLLLFSACSSNTTTSTTTATTATPNVNGFGTAKNHGHGLLALPGNVLVLATHYGLFRSSDSGATWSLVAAGPNQLMDGLMTTSLASSPINPQRLYVLTQPAVAHAKGTLGLYTSTDAGLTWQLAAPAQTTGNIYFVAPGNDTADETYIYLNNAGAQGLKVSHDAGQHFSNTGTLPFSLLGLLALPGEAGQLLAYGNNGIARSSDSGMHWQVIAGISGGVFSIAIAHANSPIYASGDNGVYVSKDSGKTFTPVYTQSSPGSLTASPTQPQVLYGKTGQAIYQSTDGGHSWTPLPSIKGNLQNLSADPQNAAILYLSLSYPMEMFRFNQSDGKWSSLTPKA